MEQVTLNGDDYILGVPQAELQGPGVYGIEDGHVVSFVPLGGGVPVEASPDNAADAPPTPVQDAEVPADAQLQSGG